MFKKLFMVALFMILSVTTFTSVAKADAYEYESIDELTDEVASIISKKNTYNFKSKFDRDDYHIDLDTNVNWKKKTVTFKGYIYRPETSFEKEKFSATLNLNNNKVKTSSKAYKNGYNTLNVFLHIWGFNKDRGYLKSLGHYLLGICEIMGKNTIFNKSGDKIVLAQEIEIQGAVFYTKATVDKSKLLKLEAEDSHHTIDIKLK